MTGEVKEGVATIVSLTIDLNCHSRTLAAGV